ncbi:hypothetical protein ABK040_006904 [Willaertia magna]
MKAGNDLFFSHDEGLILYFLSFIENYQDLENMRLISQSWKEIIEIHQQEIYNSRIETLVKRNNCVRGLKILAFQYSTFNNLRYQMIVKNCEKWKIFCNSGYFCMLLLHQSHLLKNLFHTSPSNPYQIYRNIEELIKSGKEKKTYFSILPDLTVENSISYHTNTWISILKKLKWNVALNPKKLIGNSNSLEIGCSKMGGDASIPKEWYSELSQHYLILQLNCSELCQVFPKQNEIKIPQSGWIYLFAPSQSGTLYDYDNSLKPCTPLTFKLQVCLPDKLDIKYLPKTLMRYWNDFDSREGQVFDLSTSQENTSNYLFGYTGEDYKTKLPNFARLRGYKFGFADGDVLYVMCEYDLKKGFVFNNSKAKITN